MIERVLDAARKTGCDAIHPGYGFLRNAEFARRVIESGIGWIGPPDAIESMGDKLLARQTVEKAEVPVVPGVSKAIEDPTAHIPATDIEFPAMLKHRRRWWRRHASRIHRQTLSAH